MKVDYLTRSLMFVPAHNERLMDSATRVNADVLLLDIEDSVQPVQNKQMPLIQQKLDKTLLV